MKIAHELPGRIRFRALSSYDSRLHAEFAQSLRDTVAGVSGVRSNPVARSLIVHHDGRTETRRSLVRAIANTPPAPRPRILETSPTARHLRRTAVSALTFAVGLLLPPAWRAGLTLAVVAPSLAKGANALLSRGLCVEVLDSTALGISMLRGDYAAAAATVTLLNLGEYFEATTSRSSTELLRRMLAEPPDSAWVEAGDGTLIEVPADKVRKEDIVVVGPGDMIPVDGQVISGSATVNEASITGESVPSDREAGALVLAGGVVEDGRLCIRAVRVGNATTTARIAKFIESTLDAKPAIQSSAERLADQRIFFTLVLGALTFAATRDLNRLASVFLVDYSCALKLGAPVAIKSALYRGAQANILIKGGLGIEALADVDTIVFDKTGTLTHSSLEVTDVVPINGVWTHGRLLALLASLEEHATHPVAEAIVQEARRNSLDHIHHDDVDFIVAHGLVSEVNGRRVVVGSRHFLEDHEQIAFGPFEAVSERLIAEGKTLLYAAADGTPAGVVGLRDHARSDAGATLARLRRLGIRHLVLLTGDRAEKARALAEELGLDMVFAEKRPEEKADVVRDLQARGHRVAFVGDGVNDAPALVAADVGIAMPRGADLARATADVVLLRDEIAGVAESRALAASTIGLIRSNFRWAVGLNTLLFIAAATGYASPVVSAFIHNGVTIGTLVRAVIGPRRVRRDDVRDSGSRRHDARASA